MENIKKKSHKDPPKRFKSWLGHPYMVGILTPPTVEWG